MTDLIYGSFCSLVDSRRNPSHLFSMFSFCYSLFLFLTMVLCCSFQSLMNLATDVLFSTMILAELIVVLSSAAVIKSVNRVSSVNVFLGFCCWVFLPVRHLLLL